MTYILTTDHADGGTDVELFSAHPTFTPSLGDGVIGWTLREGHVDGGDSVIVASDGTWAA